MQDLIVSVVQTRIHWEDIEANLLHFSEKLKACVGSDLIILPETFSTGFSMQTARLAQASTDKTIPWMIAQSAELGAALCGSIMYVENRNYYNALFFVHPDGKIEKYFKRHLFTPGDEAKYFTKGDKRLLVTYKGWKICPLICYDLRFPVFSRNTEEFDLLIYVANWPAKRNYAWQHLLKARAIENLSYVIACNRIGEDGHGVEHIGNSCIINYSGEEIGFSNEDKVYTFKISREPMLSFREGFPVLKDADHFKIL